MYVESDGVYEVIDGEIIPNPPTYEVSVGSEILTKFTLFFLYANVFFLYVLDWSRKKRKKVIAQETKKSSNEEHI